MIKFDKNEFLKTQIYSTLDEYETRCNVTKEIIEEIEQLLKENQKYKEVIDKAINNSQYWIDYYTRLNSDERIVLRLQENIDILKEVK